jgi:hypothetical protein
VPCPGAAGNRRAEPGPTYLRLAQEHGIDPALLHRVAVIGSGTLDGLPHNGDVVTLLAVCGCTHRGEVPRRGNGWGYSARRSGWWR